MMNGKEKIYFLLNRIEDARTIAPSGQALIIDPANDLNQNYREVELSQLFTKLEKDEKVLKILKAPIRIKDIDIIENLDPYDHSDDGCWHIKLLPAFNVYYTKIQNEPEYQEWSPSRKPAGGSISSGKKPLMTYEQKLDLIVKAIVEASKIIRKGFFTVMLYLNATNGLDRLPREEIHNILLQLQDERALKVHPLNNRLLPANQQPTHYFTLDIPDFRSWYEKRLIANKSRLESLSETNLTNITHIMHLIEQQLELDQSEKVIISFVSSIHELEGYERADIDELINTYARSLTYLKNIGVINDFTTSDMSLSSELTLNITRFFEVLEHINNLEQKYKTINKEEKKEETPNKPPDKTDIVYEITFTKDRQVLLNNFLIAKPDFDSENEVVFSFLHANPNKKHTQAEIETAINRKIAKSLHKVVENLGFTGDLKRVFIDATKNSICFKNPITKDDLNKLGIKQIKLPR